MPAWLVAIWRWLGDWVGANFADWLSIAAFLVGAFNARQIARIEQRYQFRAQIPRLRKRLGEHRSELNRLLPFEEGKAREVGVEMARCRETLRALGRVTAGETREQVARLVKDLKWWKRNSTAETEAEMIRVYEELSGLDERIGNLTFEPAWADQ